MLKVLLSILFIFTVKLSIAANTPCSGKMGGISHCDSGKFICMNGSVSRSKRVCRDNNKNTNSSLPSETKAKIYKSIDKDGIPSFSDDM